MAKKLTKEQWIEILHDRKLLRPLALQVFQTVYLSPNRAAVCGDIEVMLNRHDLNLEIGQRTGKPIAKHYNLELETYDEGKPAYYGVPFFTHAKRFEDGRFPWVLRPELISALEETGLTNKNYSRPTYLYTWKPSKFPWDIPNAKKQIELHGYYETIWGTVRKNVSIGDRFFLIKLEEEKGIMASGLVSGLPYLAPDRDTGYHVVPLRFEAIQDVDEDHITIEELRNMGNTNWATQSEGIIIDSQIADKIELRWKQIINKFNDDFSFPGLPAVIGGKEGSRKTITVTTVERNSANRDKCISYWGDSCIVCGFNFGKQFGVDSEGRHSAKGYIHVHHHNLLANAGEIITDPIHDMSPLCPNCHGVAHLKRPPYTIDELKAMRECIPNRAVKPSRAHDT